MSFRYLNAGSPSLFGNPNKNTSSTTTDSTYTKTGVAYGCNSYGGDVPIPEGLKEIWVKLDSYLVSSANVSLVTIRSQNRICYLSQYFKDLRIAVNDSNKRTITIPNGLATYWVHLKSDSKDGIFEVYVNGCEVLTYTGNVLYGEDISRLRITDMEGWVSNIIVADTPIGRTEDVVILPTTISATMTNNGDGSYSANNAGEYVKHTINRNIFESMCKSNAKVTGICMVGNPAYYDGEGIDTLQFIKDDTVISESNLPTSSSLGVVSGINVDQTISEVCTHTYGWRAK